MSSFCSDLSTHVISVWGWWWISMTCCRKGWTIPNCVLLKLSDCFSILGARDKPSRSSNLPLLILCTLILVSTSLKIKMGATRFIETIQVWVSTIQNHRLASKLCPEQVINGCSALCQSCLTAMGAAGTAGSGRSSSEVAKSVRAGQQQLIHRHGVKWRDKRQLEKSCCADGS